MKVALFAFLSCFLSLSALAESEFRFRMQSEPQTVEAAGGSVNTIAQREYPLLEPGCGQPDNVRPVRSDIQILRLQADPKCPIQWEKF